MLSIEMKINGTIIGQIYAHNVDGYMSMCSYKWHCYFIGEDDDPCLVGGVLKHDRKDGFLKLQVLLTEAAMEGIENG